MIIVTKEQFFNFIKSQPDDKELNFNQFTQYSPCGCPMIHYSREVFKENDLNVSCRDWYGRRGSYARFESGFHLIDFSADNIYNYGELKQHLKEKFPEFNWEN